MLPKVILQLLADYLDIDDVYIMKEEYKLSIEQYLKIHEIPIKKEKSFYKFIKYIGRQLPHDLRCCVSDVVIDVYLHKLDDPINWAVMAGYPEVVWHMLQSGHEFTGATMEIAICTGNLNMIKYLKSMGLLFTDTSLYLASMYDHVDVVKYLYSLGEVPDDEIKIIDMAMNKGSIKVVKYLHSIGVEESENAVERAAENGHLEMVKYLYSLGRKCSPGFVSSLGMRILPNPNIDVVLDYLRSFEMTMIMPSSHCSQMAFI